MEKLTKTDFEGQPDFLGNASRRVFVKGLGFVGASLVLATLGGCDKIAEAIKNRPLRRRLRTGSAAVDADIATYRSAVQAMKALPAADKRNWVVEANIHGTAAGFNMCEHGTDHFFDWHRAYLFWFEKKCQTLTGNAKFGLPYWNWNQNPAIHPAYLDPASVLFLPRTRTTMGTNSVVSTPTLDGIFQDTNFFTFSSQLEGTPHNNVHTYIGGTLGGTASANDPLFWNHHCMIDYCWYKWNVEMGRQNTNDQTWLGKVNGQFADANQNPATSTAAVTILMPLLAYRYESSAIGSNPAKAEVTAVKEYRALEARLKAGADIHFIVKQRTRLADQASASAGKPLMLRAPFTAANFAGILENRNATERVFVGVESANVPRPSDLFVRVFVNLPEASARTPDSDPHFAGSFAFFGNPAEGHAGHAAASGRPRFLVDITATLERLRKTGGMPADAPVTVQLVPTPFEAPPAGTQTAAAAPAAPAELTLSGVDILTTPVIVSAPAGR
ncbi:MAG: tyrosinase family protein [Allosphingosinicella sp.]